LEPVPKEHGKTLEKHKKSSVPVLSAQNSSFPRVFVISGQFL